MITINTLLNKFKAIANADPRINAFGTGQRYDILTDIHYYPYFWVVADIAHDILYTDVNKYRAIEFNFVLRVADKNNNQINMYDAVGLNSNNGQDITSDTFTILSDIINCISEDSLGLFTNIGLIGDISAEPFYNEDSGDVNGFEAQITLRVRNENPCISPLTDIDTPIPTPEPPAPPVPANYLTFSAYYNTGASQMFAQDIDICATFNNVANGILYYDTDLGGVCFSGIGTNQLTAGYIAFLDAGVWYISEFNSSGVQVSGGTVPLSTVCP
jgi:hypothetical protein